jgi:hypothetical protein
MDYSDHLYITRSPHFETHDPAINRHFGSAVEEEKFYSKVLEPGSYEKGFLANVASIFRDQELLSCYSSITSFSKQLAQTLLFGQELVVPITSHSVGPFREYFRTVSWLLHQNNQNTSFSLLLRSKQAGQMISCEKLALLFLDWHWFLYDLIAHAFPRALTLLFNHPIVLTRLVQESREVDLKSPTDIHECRFLRFCLLEALRLHPSRLLVEWKAKQSQPTLEVSKGDQLMTISNHFLRDSERFSSPNCYDPLRWTTASDDLAMMWGLSPTQEPLKEVAIYLLKTLVLVYLRRINFGIDRIRHFYPIRDNSEPLNPHQLHFKSS